MLTPENAGTISDTFGVMVYQEDVLKVAHGFANLTLAEADILRRAMSGKFRSGIEFQRITDKWFNNCKELGYSEELAKEVWRQIESFSGYSFSKAHSARFAVESYQSLYLKTYFPLEFMVAVINNFGGFYSTEFYIHEARRYGAIIEAPEINQSEYLTRIEENVIWLGWIHIKSLESRVIDAILNERTLGEFLSFSNFVQRVNIGLEQIIILIRIGAFHLGILGHQREAYLRFNGRYQPNHYKQSLFGYVEQEANKFPVLLHNTLEDAYDQIELLGFPLCNPFSMIFENTEKAITSDQLMEFAGRNVKRMDTW